jgi:transcriptional regulator with XRE-family HTH domain
MEDDFLNVCNRLGSVISAKRKLIGLSQEELAFRAEIDRTYISQIERGVSNPSLLVIFKISKVLQLRLTDLLTT